MEGPVTADYPALFRFLEWLRDNNDRQLFAGQRDRYERLRKMFVDDVQRMINAMGVEEPLLRKLSARDAVYRIYRDIRFTPDKSPFKTYFSALISPRGRHWEDACWYLHVGIDECAIYGGMWTPESRVLRKVRKAIVDNVEEFRAITETETVRREYPGWYGRQLKTAPQGYSREHPDIDLLRLTEYGKEHRLSHEYFEQPDWPERAAHTALLLKPMIDFLNYSIHE